MAKKIKQGVTAGHDAVGVTQIAGNHNTATTTINFNSESAPAVPEETLQAFQELTQLLLSLDSADKIKIENAMAEVGHELGKDEPDNDEVEDALKRALKTASKTEGYLELAGKLMPKLTTIGTWLGTSAAAIVAMVG